MTASACACTCTLTGLPSSSAYTYVHVHAHVQYVHMYMMKRLRNITGSHPGLYMQTQSIRSKATTPEDNSVFLKISCLSTCTYVHVVEYVGVKPCGLLQCAVIPPRATFCITCTLRVWPTLCIPPV